MQPIQLMIVLSMLCFLFLTIYAFSTRGWIAKTILVVTMILPLCGIAICLDQSNPYFTIDKENQMTYQLEKNTTGQLLSIDDSPYIKYYVKKDGKIYQHKSIFVDVVKTDDAPYVTVGRTTKKNLIDKIGIQSLRPEGAILHLPEESYQIIKTHYNRIDINRLLIP